MNTPNQESVTCPKCGGSHVMQNIAVEPRENGSLASLRLTVALSRPGFLGFSSTVRGDVSATVCADCGYTELHADNLAELWQAYSQENR